jgi:hypothetical protein
LKWPNLNPRRCRRRPFFRAREANTGWVLTARPNLKGAMLPVVAETCCSYRLRPHPDPLVANERMLLCRINGLMQLIQHFMKTDTLTTLRGVLL